MHLARHAARAGAGQPRRAAARALRLAPAPTRSCESSRSASRACCCRPRRCARSASSSRRPPTRASPPSSRCRSSATPARGGAGVFVAAAALAEPGWEHALEQCDRRRRTSSTTGAPTASGTHCAVAAARVAAAVAGPVESALCPHGAGPPSCWCRPPLPGLALAFAREHRIDLSRSWLIGSAPAQKTLATTLGARYVAVSHRRGRRGEGGARGGGDRGGRGGGFGQGAEARYEETGEAQWARLPEGGGPRSRRGNCTETRVVEHRRESAYRPRSA